jgi:ferritin
MASWAECHGFSGTAAFLYTHSDEERQHMLKLVKFINERQGTAIIPAIKQPKISFNSLVDVFQALLDHELAVTESINKIIGACLDERDYTTHNFMQWYVTEQLEEEALARELLSQLHMIGDNKAGLYQFDRDMKTFDASSSK